MIPLKTLDALITQKIKDASVLLAADRHSNAVYLMGYAVEIALKRKITLALHFTDGFPETKQEFAQYAAVRDNNLLLQSTVKSLSDIHHHDLSKLLLYSGFDKQVIDTLSSEWTALCEWDPKHRYQCRRFSQKKARSS